MKNLFYYLLAILMIFSCQKVLELEAENKTPKLVVNSLFSPNERWEVDVSRSLSVLDNGNLDKVDNATVTIFENGSSIANLTYDGEKYISFGLSAAPEVGKQYEIEVAAPDFETVTSQNSCPVPVPILRVDTSTVSNTFGQEKVATITFADPSGIDNYYAIELDVEVYFRQFNSTTGDWDTNFVASDRAFLSSSNPVIDNGGPDNSAVGLTFKDVLFQGQQKSITFNYFEFVSGGGPNQFTVQKLRLSSLSEEAYNYKKSINAYRSVDGNPFAEPVQVFTNVENGFGIFAGESIFELEY